MAVGDGFIQKNLFSIIPLVLSVVTAVASSWAMQARLDERVSRSERDIIDVKGELKDKVAKEEIADLKKTLDEVKSDIKELLKARRGP